MTNRPGSGNADSTDGQANSDRRAWMMSNLAKAERHFGVQTVGPPVYTDRLHSIGARATNPKSDEGASRNVSRGQEWLRVVYDDPDWGYGASYLDGNLTANEISNDIPKPHVRQWHQWDDQGRTLRAELHTYIPDAPVTNGVHLTTEPHLSNDWISKLRTALDTLAKHPVPGHGLDAEDVNNGIRAFFGINLDISTVPWTAAHRDLHWGNVTGPNLHILDWEIWGKAPAGYDAATLHCTGLLAPQTAQRIATALKHQLDTHAGRIATLAAATRFLRFADAGDYISLAVPLHRYAQAIAEDLRRYEAGNGATL